MADTNITAAVAGAFIPEVWSSEILRAVENNLVMANIVKRYDADVAQKGDTIHIPNLSNITATYKLANTDVPQTATTETSSTITIDKHAVDRVDIEDITKIQSNYNLMREYTEKLGYGIGKLMDSDLIALYSGLSQTVGATASNVGIAKSYVLGAIQKLDAAVAPQSDRHFVVEAYGKKQLFNIDDFIRYDSTGAKSPVLTGELGELYGVKCHFTQQVTNSGSLVYGMMFHKEAFALAVQKNMSVESEREVKRLANVVVASALYGVAELRDTFGVVLTYGVNG